MSESRSPSKTIREFKPGDSITAFFVLRKRELKTKKDGAPYLSVELGDHTGRIAATIWDDAEAHYKDLHVGVILKVKGRVVTYRDSHQLNVERFRKAEPSDGIGHRDFVRRGPVDIAQQADRLKESIASIKNANLRRLLELRFEESAWFEKFADAPGGKLWHHAYLGGLIEHTMSVVNICETLTTLYPSVNRDLLIAGALLHDVGKVEEYGYEQGFIDYTDEGRLWGHISIGAQQIRSLIESLEKDGEFPITLKDQIIHLILSHQGELEHGSPVLPATLEAIILYYADEMDSKANAIKNIIERDSEPGRKWSQYIPLLNRFIFIGKDDAGGESESLFD